MKHFIVLLAAVMSLAMTACNRGADIVDPQAHGSPGQLHNEFLAELHAAIDARGGASAVSPRDKDEIIYTVTNDILACYDEPPMSHDEIQDALEQGTEIAGSEDPWKIVQPLMSATDYKWLRRYVNDAEVHEAREVYQEHCRMYGAPTQGSLLWTCIDITVSSAEYWYQRDLERAAAKGDVGLQRVWWKRLIKSAVVCASDGVAGTLAASGGGVVGGVIVGYLASYAVDDIIEGEL